MSDTSLIKEKTCLQQALLEYRKREKDKKKREGGRNILKGENNIVVLYC